MRTKAAILWELGGKWEVENVELDGPRDREVLVRLTARTFSKFSISNSLRPYITIPCDCTRTSSRSKGACHAATAAKSETSMRW